MTFQLQILTSSHAERFPPAILKEARKIFKEIRMAMLEADSDQDPFRVPQSDKVEELVFFLAMVGDDEWMRDHVDVFEFVEAAKHFIGFGLRKDRAMRLGEEGMAHLGASEIRAFTPLNYVKAQIEMYFRLHDIS